MVQENGLIGIWYTDSRGRRASPAYVNYWGGETKLTGDMIARAATHFDTNEIERVNAYNRKLMIYFIRLYIHGLVTGRVVGEGSEMPKYSQWTLTRGALENTAAAWQQYKEMSEGQTVNYALIN